MSIDKEKILVGFKNVGKNGKKIIKATEGSVGFDVFSDKTENGGKWTIYPFSCEMIKTGVALQMPQNVCGRLSLRSSIGKKGLMLVNGVGVIDSDFTGEIEACVFNWSNQIVYIEENERFAQIVFENVLPIIVVDSFLQTNYDEGRGKFGSTGKF